MGLTLPDSRLMSLSRIFNRPIALSAAYPLIVFESPLLECKVMVSIKVKTNYLMLRWPVNGQNDTNTKAEHHFMCTYPEDILDFLGYTKEQIQEHFPDYDYNIVQL